jgi:elongation factor Tu
VGDEVAIVGRRDTVTTTATSIERFRELTDEVRAGDTAGVLLSAIARSNVERGQVLAKPGSIAAHARFSARIYLLTGRDVAALPELQNLSGDQALKQGERPQFHFRTAAVAGTVELLANDTTVAPGAPAEIRVVLEVPMAMEPGTRFKIMEGGRTKGVGMVSGTID